MSTKVKKKRKRFRFKSVKPQAIVRRFALQKTHEVLKEHGLAFDLDRNFSLSRQRKSLLSKLGLLAGSVLLRPTVLGVPVPRTSAGWRTYANTAIKVRSILGARPGREEIKYERRGIDRSTKRAVRGRVSPQAAVMLRMREKIIGESEVCAERRERRSVLFASGRAGTRKVARAPRTFRDSSKVRC